MVQSAKAKGGKEIPIPTVEFVPTYKRDYLPTFTEQSTYIRGRGALGRGAPRLSARAGGPVALVLPCPSPFATGRLSIQSQNACGRRQVRPTMPHAFCRRTSQDFRTCWVDVNPSVVSACRQGIRAPQHAHASS